MSRAVAGSDLYRRVWRWHFYAGLVCLPFLAMMALSGGLYLFKDPIESIVHARVRIVEPREPWMDAERLVDRARMVTPGKAVRFVAPSRAGHSAEVGIRTADGVLSVYLDPADGRVLGRLRDDLKPMALVKAVHSLAIAGTLANHWIEVVAGWAIVLVVSGIFLWWPRGRAGGVFSLRGRPAQRNWWRDLHAVTGLAACAAILFLAVTGMPWSAFWGAQFGRLTNEWGIGLPSHLFGPGPESASPLANLGTVPWALGWMRLPESAPAAAGHPGHAAHGRESSPSGDAAHAGHPSDPASVIDSRQGEGAPSSVAGQAEASIGLNEALRIFGQLGLPAGTPVALPDGARGVYSAMRFPDDVQGQRVVHLDRYSGAVLADVGYRDYGAAGRLAQWGINLHTGVQFGWINKLVMLAGCLAILALTVSAAVMWWKRRPQGRLGAPPRTSGSRVALGVTVVAVGLGVVYPLLGASMLVAMLVDWAVPQRWHERWGL